MVKIFEGPVGGGLPNCAHEISYILFTYSDFIFLLYLSIPKVSCVYLEWLKSLNFEGPPFGALKLLKFYRCKNFMSPT